MLLADENSVIDTKVILKQIRKTINEAQPDPRGDVYISIYYSGHGAQNRGDWVFRDGAITL